MANESIEIVKRVLTEETGLQISLDVAKAASEDPALFRQIIAARGNPTWIKQLVRLKCGREIGQSERRDPNLGQLAANLVSSQVEYAKRRFASSNETEFRRRLAVCSSCPNLEESKDSVVHFLGRKMFRPEDDRICGLCGCFVTSKARRRHEKCPDRDPKDASVNRWGQEI